MSSRTTLVLGGLALAASLPLTAQSCATRILCVGDSITEGYGGQVSFRRDLWHLLRSHGCAIDMVGTRNGVQNLAVPNACDFDMDHDAVTGITVFSTTLNPPSTAGADIALVLLGINDIHAAIALGYTPTDAANWVYDHMKLLTWIS